MIFAPPARHLLRARDLADARYAEALTVADMATAAGLSRAHFSTAFRETFGETPHAYLLTRRLERAAALLHDTDRPVFEICLDVGLGARAPSRRASRACSAALRRPTAPRTRRPPSVRSCPRA